MTLVKFNKPVSKTFNNLFEELINDFPYVSGRELSSTVAPVNISETSDAYHVELSAPGRNKEDFNVSIEKDLFTISFEKNNETTDKEAKTVRKEFSYQNFKRSFSLDGKVDIEKIQAKYENGLLKFYLPKIEQVKETSKQISVQ